MRRSPLLILLALIPALSLLAACGASGGDDAGSDDTPTTTAAESDGGGDPTTTAAGSADPGDSGDGPTPAALAEILPTVDDIGPGYEVSDEDLADDADDADDAGDDEDDADEESDPTEQAIIDACPGAEFLDELDSSGASTTEVSREFSTEADATIEVALDGTPPDFDEATVDQVVEALSDCGPISTEDEDGNAIEMEISAEKTDEYGDYGLSMSLTARFSMMGMTIPIEFEGLIFSVDGTSVSVVATSGLDDNTMESVPADVELVPELAALMQERVEAL